MASPPAPTTAAPTQAAATPPAGTPPVDTDYEPDNSVTEKVATQKPFDPLATTQTTAKATAPAATMPTKGKVKYFYTFYYGNSNELIMIVVDYAELILT